MTITTVILGRPQQAARRRQNCRPSSLGALRSEQDHQRWARVQKERPELMSDQSAAQICYVSVRMIGLWVEAGAWPLPDAVFGKILCFRISDVEYWLGTGAWPSRVRFRGVKYRESDRHTPR